jgi:hypothetical protein
MSKGSEEVKRLMELSKEATGLPPDGNPNQLKDMLLNYTKTVISSDPLDTDTLINLAVGVSTAAHLWAIVAADEIYDEEPSNWFKAYILRKNGPPLRLVDN